MRSARRYQHERWVSALLVGHWAWSALAYHVAFFTRINPAAWLFAALFLGQAVLFFRVGVGQRRLSFAPWGSAWATAMIQTGFIVVRASREITQERRPT